MTTELRAAILESLAPVRPLKSPASRATRLFPIIALLALGIPLYFGIRPDFSWLVATTSTLLLAAGAGFIALALWDAVPGRNASARPLWFAGVAAIVMFVFTMAPAAASARFAIPPAIGDHVFRVCLRTPAVLGLPLLALALILIFRAFPVRPAAGGALAGLGCGLIVESGWRVYCHFSDPIHVLTTHGAAVAMLSAAGYAAAWLYARMNR